MPLLYPIRAVNFVRAPVELQDICIQNYLVPVNDVFFDFWNCEAKIMLLYGGPGGTKSTWYASKLINECMNRPYFKCIYGRKVKDNVRESMFATLCDFIETYGLQDEFIYSRAPKSSMVIRHWPTGNIFLPFGADNVKKLKSLKDPTHIWCDEFDQFDQADFMELLPRLRKPGVKTQFCGCFNTKDVNPDHWLWKLFFDPKKPFLDQLRERIPDADLDLVTVFCNYTENVFINHKEYEQVLWMAAGFNEEVFRQTAKGEWGSTDMSGKYAWAFAEGTHIVDMGTPEGRERMKIDPSSPLYISFDFNVDPMTAIVFQFRKDQWLKVFAEIRLRNSDIFEMINRIKTDYGEYFIIITGDASGKNRSGLTKGKRSYVTTIKKKLKLKSTRSKFPSANPSYGDARLVLNAVLKKLKVEIASTCMFLIDDLKTIKVDSHGLINKIKEEKKGKNHLLDTFKYACWNFLRSIVRMDDPDEQTPDDDEDDE